MQIHRKIGRFPFSGKELYNPIVWDLYDERFIA